MIKCVRIKYIKVWSNGTVTFENTFLKSVTQSVVCGKDRTNAFFSQKIKSLNLTQKLSSTSYKAKYKL